MLRKFNIALLSILLLSGYGQFALNAQNHSQKLLERLINKGEYTEASKLIKHIIAEETISKQEEYDLGFRLEVLNRIKKDFSKSEDQTLENIKKLYPSVSKEEIAKWENSNAIENKIIDGKKYYFYNAAKNLFRIEKEAREKISSINGRQSKQLDSFLCGYIPQIVKQAKSHKKNSIGIPFAPKTVNITYRITVKPNQVPDGEIIRVWMPYPRSNQRQTNVKLISCSEKNYIISPDTYKHKSIYLEKRAVKDSICVFEYKASYTSFNQWFNFTVSDIKPYDTTSKLYKEFTAQRKEHIIFTPKIKTITDSIIGKESNPYLKAVKIFDYIAENYPWASAREYSTISNIPEYVIENKHGDCGQQSLLFITMARYAGIPAKWESGWMLHPGEENLHDWASAYFQGIGWVPVDQSFGRVGTQDNNDVFYFYTKGIDCYRMIVNDDFSCNFFPAKTHYRSETVDFQRGEVEWKGENLYFGRWNYKMDVSIR